METKLIQAKNILKLTESDLEEHKLHLACWCTLP
jgi:hypothetical protein